MQTKDDSDKQTINLSIKNVPVDIAEKLRSRAARNHRSLQGELMAILEASVAERTLNPREVLERVRSAGMTPSDDNTPRIGDGGHVNLRR